MAELNLGEQDGSCSTPPWPSSQTNPRKMRKRPYSHIFTFLPASTHGMYYPGSVARSFLLISPSGECASHFRQILIDFPPQVSTRSSAAAWACHVHNEVNKSLEKELFDCSKIGDFYDCGCGEDEEKLKGDKIDVQKEVIG